MNVADDADHPAVHVKQRPARVAAIDRRVGLQEFDRHAAGERAAQLASGAEVAAGQAVIERVRGADDEHRVADVCLRGIAEPRRSDAARRPFELKQSHVGAHQRGDDAGRRTLAVAEQNFDPIGGLDDVGGSHHLAVGADQHAGAEAFVGRPAPLGRGGARFGADDDDRLIDRFENLTQRCGLSRPCRDEADERTSEKQRTEFAEAHVRVFPGCPGGHVFLVGGGNSKSRRPFFARPRAPVLMTKCVATVPSPAHPSGSPIGVRRKRVNARIALFRSASIPSARKKSILSAFRLEPP